MNKLQTVLAIILYMSIFGSSLSKSSICHFTYECNSNHIQVHYNSTYNNQINLCTKEHIPKDVLFNVMLDAKNSSREGIIKINFKAPNEQCIYKVALFVNSEITDSIKCKMYKFDKSNNAEIHTMEKTICPKSENITENEDNKTKPINSLSCNEQILSLWYEYIYTGCYTLGFKIEEDYITVGNIFLKTDYKKIDLMEPNLRCTYKSTFNKFETGFEMVAITVDISLLVGSSGLQLEVAPTSSLFKNKIDACSRYNENSIIKVLLGMSRENNTDLMNNNCTISTTSLSTGDYKIIECNFNVQNSSKDIGYCFLVRLLDDRCHKSTSWKPFFNSKIPCAWIQYCTKIEQNISDHVEELKTEVTNKKIMKLPKILYVILFIAIILLISAALSAIFTTYRKHTQSKKRSFNVKIKSINIQDNQTDDLKLCTYKSENEKLIKGSGIVILYVKESEHFMNFMLNLRQSLQKHTGCEVYDWWAQDLWNDVARVGGYEWVVKMIREDYRIVWVDTLKARLLLTLENRNKYSKSNNENYSFHSPEISDFRDSAFPSIVDFVKRNTKKMDQEYQRHFIIRTENFTTADKMDDPFADISPHTRYLIPYHFDKLCYQLAPHELCFEGEIKAIKNRLRKYLVQEPIMNM